MAAQNTDRQNVSRIQDFLGHVCAEVTYNLVSCFFFPCLGVLVSIVNPLAELREYFINQIKLASCLKYLVYNSDLSNIRIFPFIFTGTRDWRDAQASNPIIEGIKEEQEGDSRTWLLLSR
jgi:hypothetical protein